MAEPVAPLELLAPRLKLRPFALADHVAYAAMSADAEVMLHRPRVISLIRPANQRSIALAERLGAASESKRDFLGGESLLYVHRTPAR